VLASVDAAWCGFPALLASLAHRESPPTTRRSRWRRSRPCRPG